MKMRSDTKQRLEEMLRCGMTQLSKQECIDAFAAIGYTIYDFEAYYNGSNTIKYDAIRCRQKETDTGISAFHYKDARRDDNFRKMQHLRFSYFGVHDGRIIEL